MASGEAQGKVWGVHPQDWADLQEGKLKPAYEAVFGGLDIGSQTRLLDVGCGSGMALQMAAERGAQVSGLDASSPFLEVARQRVPQAELATGEMEQLAYPDDHFDVVTGFNSFQFAANPANALREVRRVLKPGGRVALVIWGQPHECEHFHSMKAIGSLLPPPPPCSPGPFVLSAPGKVRELLLETGFTPGDSGELNCPFDYPDEATALQALCSSGPVVRAIHTVGEEKVRQTMLDSFAPYRTEQGGIRQNNLFRYYFATA